MLPQQQTRKKRMIHKVLDRFLAPHPSLPLPVPLSFSLISLEAGGRDHFAQEGGMVPATKCVSFIRRPPALVHIACVSWINQVHGTRVISRLSCPFASGSGP